MNIKTQKLPDNCFVTVLSNSIEQLKPIVLKKPELIENHRPLSDISAEIIGDWKKINFGAKPYLREMIHMDKINEYVGLEDGVFVVLYFLSNAQTWRGATARKIKKELNSMIEDFNNAR